MKSFIKVLTTFTLAFLIVSGLSSCKKKEGCTDPNANNFDVNATVDDGSCTYDPVESTTELLVRKFDAAPVVDGAVDDMWQSAQKLIGEVEVPDLVARGTYLNSDGQGIEENLGLFYPYSGEKYPFTMRAGYYGDKIYMLIEWEDSEDSKDRQSWYFDANSKRWKQQHKYANDPNDKYYEDKFAFLFPIGDVTDFNNTTCYATCHGPSLPVVKAKDKHTRHYLNKQDEKVDMWHWKRVRGAYADQADDQKMIWDDVTKGSSANGRTGDANGESGYSDNKVTLQITGSTDEVSVPKYIIPGQTDYYWIDKDQIADGTAKEVVAVDANGVLTLADNSTIDPNGDPGYAPGTGNKRVPSVTLKPFAGGRADIEVKAVYTGTGWRCELVRKLNTGDPDDVVFDPAKELYFGFAIFNNAAIAHAIKPGLLMKFEL